MLTTKTKRLSLILLSVIMAFMVALGFMLPSSNVSAENPSLFTGLVDAQYSEVSYHGDNWNATKERTKAAYALTTKLPDQANAITYTENIVLKGGEQSIVRFGITGSLNNQLTLNHGILTFRLTDAFDPTIYAEFRFVQVQRAWYASASNSANVDSFAATDYEGTATKYDGRTPPQSWGGSGAMIRSYDEIIPSGELFFDATNKTASIICSSVSGNVVKTKFANFNDTENQLANAWGGFTSNEVVLTIFGESYGIWTGSDTQKLAIETVGGEYVYDTEKPLFSNLSNASYGSVSFAKDATVDTETESALLVDLPAESAAITYNREIDVPFNGGASNVVRLGGWGAKDLAYPSLHIKVADAFDEGSYFEVRTNRSNDSVRAWTVRNSVNTDAYSQQVLDYKTGAFVERKDIPLSQTSWGHVGDATVYSTADSFGEIVYINSDVVHGVFLIYKDSSVIASEKIMQIADFNSTNQFTNAWNGIISGKAKVSIYGSNSMNAGQTPEKAQLAIVSIGGVPANAAWADSTTTNALEIGGDGTFSVTGLKTSYELDDEFSVEATFSANDKTAPAYVKIYSQDGKQSETGKCKLLTTGGYDVFFYAEIDGKLYVESKSILVVERMIASTSDITYEEVTYQYGSNSVSANALTMALTGKENAIKIVPKIALGAGEKSIIKLGTPGNLSSTYPLGYGLLFVKVSDANDPSKYFEVRFIQRDSQWYVAASNNSNVDKFGGQHIFSGETRYSKGANRYPANFGSIGNVFFYANDGYTFTELSYDKSANILYATYNYGTGTVKRVLANFADTTNQFDNAWTGFANTTEVNVSIWGENCTYFTPSTTAQKLAIEAIGGQAVMENWVDVFDYEVAPELEVMSYDMRYTGETLYADDYVIYANAIYGESNQYYYDPIISYEWKNAEDQTLSTEETFVPETAGEYTLSVTATDAFNNSTTKTCIITVEDEPVFESPVKTAENGARLRVNESGYTGLMFETTIEKAAFVGAPDGTTFRYGTLIIPADKLANMANGQFTMEAFEEALEREAVLGTDYIDVAVDGFYAAGETADNYMIRATLINIKPHNYYRSFVGIGYVVAVVGGQEMAIFADFDMGNARSVFEVGLSAYEDRSVEQTGDYEYEVGDGTYSQLDADQLAIAKEYVDSVAVLVEDGGEIKFAGEGFVDYYTAPYTATLENGTLTVTSTVVIKTVVFNDKVYTAFDTAINDGKTVTLTVSAQ